MTTAASKPPSPVSLTTFAESSIASPVSSNASSIFSFVDGDGSLAGASPFAPELPPTIELQRMRLESDV